jgi:hypothetical protein
MITANHSISVFNPRFSLDTWSRHHCAFLTAALCSDVFCLLCNFSFVVTGIVLQLLYGCVVIINGCYENHSYCACHFQDSARARRQGAIIESMHHHGKGVYSGTFSGMMSTGLGELYSDNTIFRVIAYALTTSVVSVQWIGFSGCNLH